MAGLTGLHQNRLSNYQSTQDRAPGAALACVHAPQRRAPGFSSRAGEAQRDRKARE